MVGLWGQLCLCHSHSCRTRLAPKFTQKSEFLEKPHLHHQQQMKRHCNGYGVSLWEDEKVLEMDGWWRLHQGNVFHAPEHSYDSREWAPRHSIIKGMGARFPLA